MAFDDAARAAPTSVRPGALAGQSPTFRFAVGLLALTGGMALLSQAGLGVPPWEVLTLGLVSASGLDETLVRTLVLAGFLLAMPALRARIRCGTLVVVAAYGPLIAGWEGLLSPPTGLPGGLYTASAGVAAISVGSGTLLSGPFGAGPVDTVLGRLPTRTGSPLWAFRLVTEAGALAVGWFLGGPAGVAPAAYAFASGPLVHATLTALDGPFATRATSLLGGGGFVPAPSSHWWMAQVREAPPAVAERAAAR